MTPELMRVMYAPLDYVHPYYFNKPKKSMSASAQQVVNHTLIKKYKLITQIDFSLKSNDLSSRFVVNWGQLPDVAWLLGCKLARADLARSAYLAKLPRHIRQFIALPVDCPMVADRTTRSLTDIKWVGANCIFQWARAFPPALEQRLQLMFDPNSPPFNDEVAVSRQLLNYAIDYAKNITH